MNINRKWSLVCVMCGSIGMAVTVLRADDPAAPPVKPTSQPAPHVSVGREMSGMSRAYKVIRKQITDPTKNASTIAAVQDLEMHTLAAKGAIPHIATTLPSAPENADKRAAYEKEMITLFRQELDLEEQLLAGDNDKAAKTAAGLHDLEEEGHKEFRMHKAPG